MCSSCNSCWAWKKKYPRSPANPAVNNSSLNLPKYDEFQILMCEWQAFFKKTTIVFLKVFEGNFWIYFEVFKGFQRYFLICFCFSDSPDFAKPHIVVSKKTAHLLVSVDCCESPRASPHEVRRQGAGTKTRRNKGSIARNHEHRRGNTTKQKESWKKNIRCLR